MPFRRMSRRRTARRGSSNKLRGVYWDGNVFRGDLVDEVPVGDWMVLPAIPEIELRDSTNLGFLQPREDVTLERTLIDLTAQAQQRTDGEFAAWFGLIALDWPDPTTVPTTIPDPANPSEEWIWRQGIGFPKNPLITGVLTIGSLLDPNKTQVRSKRKLPAETGIFAVARLDGFGGGVNPVSFVNIFRFLFKKPK